MGRLFDREKDDDTKKDFLEERPAGEPVDDLEPQATQEEAPIHPEADPDNPNAGSSDQDVQVVKLEGENTPRKMEILDHDPSVSRNKGLRVIIEVPVLDHITHGPTAESLREQIRKHVGLVGLNNHFQDFNMYAKEYDGFKFDDPADNGGTSADTKHAELKRDDDDAIR